MKTTVSTISEQGDSYLLWITEGFLPVINVKQKRMWRFERVPWIEVSPCC